MFPSCFQGCELEVEIGSGCLSWLCQHIPGGTCTLSAVFVREEGEWVSFRHETAGLECGGLGFCSSLSCLVVLGKRVGDVILPWESGTLLGNPSRTAAHQSPG